MFPRLSAAIAAICLVGGGAFAQSVAKPTDPQIAHIAYTAGVVDVAAARQALARSKNKDVRAFAQDMMRDHEAVNKQAAELVKRLNVKPEDNDTSRALIKHASDKQVELSKLSGGAFDRAYIASELAFHRTATSALQTLLIPSASNAELRSLLETRLKVFRSHEQHAELVALALK